MRLSPQELRQAKGLVADVRTRVEAVLEIDTRAHAGGAAAACPRCGTNARPVESDQNGNTAMDLHDVRPFPIIGHCRSFTLA